MTSQPCQNCHGCRAKDVAQAAADGYRQDFDSFAALGSCSTTTAVPSTETNSPWDPPNPALALPLPAEPTASDGHLPKVLSRHHSGARTCPAMAGTCPVCTVVCDRVAFDKLPFSSLTTPAPPHPLTQARYGRGQRRVTPGSPSQDFLALTPSAANGKAASVSPNGSAGQLGQQGSECKLRNRNVLVSAACETQRAAELGTGRQLLALLHRNQQVLSRVPAWC